ncbi:ParB N-terminal domain-containing protein [Anabaena sp. WFMT]|uniref:ParB N-terminal domain-containing protein n=1 Tax=Anabaena sp. WFMT TaxID=3449730 RepID=UPI003F22D299
MKLSTSLVAIKKISCTKPRSTFADDELEKAAALILESEGVINPIVIRRTDIQSYEVVDGDFEYYAAARAREIDPRKGEMIGVFIIESENEETLTKQVEVFRKQKSEDSGKVDFTLKDLEKFLTNFEAHFGKITKQLLEEATTNARLENENKELKKQITDKIEHLEVFKTLDKIKIADKLISAGVSSKKAYQIAELVEKERNQEQFQSLNDVVDRVKIPHGKKKQRAISLKEMLEIVNIWSKK